jgi:hypothetical protein
MKTLCLEQCLLRDEDMAFFTERNVDITHKQNELERPTREEIKDDKGTET